MIKKLLGLILLLGVFVPAFSQTGGVRGTVKSSGNAINNALISVVGTNISSTSSLDGTFRIDDVPAGNRELLIIAEGFVEYRFSVSVLEGQVTDLGDVLIDQESDENNIKQNIPVVLLTDQQIETVDNESQDISGILSASRDVFVNTAAFTFGTARFRIRGYDSENTTVLLNGLPVNEADNGRVFWGLWGGLNDVTRNRNVKIGLAAHEDIFGGVGGATSFNLRPTAQRTQTRVSASLSNRSYRYRLMATHSTGLLPGNWAFTISASRRWADEGYIEGTFYDAYSYFIGIEKKVNEKHSLSFIGFGAPTKRGRTTSSIQEVYDLTGDNYYNANWGYQNGEKRNARVGDTHRPWLMLSHYWDISDRTSITTNAGYQFGKNGVTALDWNTANDPRPDYYRKLPSFQTNERLAEEIADAWANDPSVNQIDWDRLYQVNRDAPETIRGVGGNPEESITGFRAHYVVEDRRFDPEVLTFASNLKHSFTDDFTLQGGFIYKRTKIKTFKVLEDLLGADFYLDIDRFAERDFPDLTADIVQSDLQNPVRIAYEGDEVGYRYDINHVNADIWAQTQYSTRKFDLFAALRLQSRKFWREGFFQAGTFPDNSLGESEKFDYLTYSVKMGATYKLTGRHYFYANGFIGTRAPFSREAFVSVRTSNITNPYLTEETILSVEGGYQLRSPFVKARVSGYYTQFQDRTRIRAFFNDFDNAFEYFILGKQDFIHRGIEMAAEVKVSPTLTVNGVGALGVYHHSNRPVFASIRDRESEFRAIDETAYLDDYLIGGTPMTAAALGLNYNSPKYWFLNLTLSYVDNSYLDVAANRRRLQAIEVFEFQSEEYYEFLSQEKFDGGYSLDLFGGKSFKFGDTFLYLNVGVNNILNDKNLRTGGFEQSRTDDLGLDSDLFPPRYFYRFGTNYFVNLTFRI